MIDSKPIQPPYLNLIPLKNYHKKDQELGRNLIKEQTGLNNSTISDFKSAIGGFNSTSINWGKMLNEDLEELIKEKATTIEENPKRKRSEI